MIPLAHIQQWTAHAPWPDLRQVEQDLIICRAMCDLFSHPDLQGKMAFRGGTAINKLLFGKSLRYSEDIAPLLPAGVTFDDDAAIAAFGRVWGDLIARIPGESWKSTKTVIEAIRKAKIPALLVGIYE